MGQIFEMLQMASYPSMSTNQASCMHLLEPNRMSVLFFFSRDLDRSIGMNWKAGDLLEGFGDDFGFGFWAGKPDRGSPPCTQKKSTAEKKTPPLDAHLRSEIRSIGVNGF